MKAQLWVIVCWGIMALSTIGACLTSYLRPEWTIYFLITDSIGLVLFAGTVIAIVLFDSNPIHMYRAKR